MHEGREVRREVSFTWKMGRVESGSCVPQGYLVLPPYRVMHFCVRVRDGSCDALVVAFGVSVVEWLP